MQPLQKWIPDRKVLSAGLAGILAWFILAGLADWGIDPQPLIDSFFAIIGTPAPAAQPFLAGVIAWGVAYFLPAADRDVLKRIDDRIAQLAGYLPAQKPPGPQP